MRTAFASRASAKQFSAPDFIEHVSYLSNADFISSRPARIFARVSRVSRGDGIGEISAGGGFPQPLSAISKENATAKLIFFIGLPVSIVSEVTLFGITRVEPDIHLRAVLKIFDTVCFALNERPNRRVEYFDWNFINFDLGLGRN